METRPTAWSRSTVSTDSSCRKSGILSPCTGPTGLIVKRSQYEYSKLTRAARAHTSRPMFTTVWWRMRNIPRLHSPRYPPVPIALRIRSDDQIYPSGSSAAHDICRRCVTWNGLCSGSLAPCRGSGPKYDKKTLNNKPGLCSVGNSPPKRKQPAD